MKRELNGITIECIRGNITEQESFAAVVNAANAELRMGGGVAGAIHRAAGPELTKECRKYAPIRPGEAVITRGYRLPNKWVIHCLGPVYGMDRPENELLADCYRNALRIAEKNEIDSIAFPSISTGFFGYPMEEAAEIAFKTVIELIPELKRVKRIRFVLYDNSALEIHERVLSKVLS
jgi:O-acetyl-ADP-ribose deacetylase (regulator of RNase III)